MRLAIGLVLLAACSDLRLDERKFACTTSADCTRGSVCRSDNVCGEAEDAGPPLDAAEPDAAQPDAEAPDATPRVVVDQDFDNPGSRFQLIRIRGNGPISIVDGDPPHRRFARLVDFASTRNLLAFEPLILPRAAQIITTDFDFRFTARTASAADGIGFVMLARSVFDPGLLASTEYGEDAKASLLIGIGFDIFDNPGDLEGDDVAIMFNAMLVLKQAAGFRMADGSFHHARVIVRDDGGDLRVDVVLRSSTGATFDVMSDVRIAGQQLYDMIPTFAGKTGQLVAAHDIDNITITVE